MLTVIILLITFVIGIAVGWLLAIFCLLRSIWKHL